MTDQQESTSSSMSKKFGSTNSITSSGVSSMNDLQMMMDPEDDICESPSTSSIHSPSSPKAILSEKEQTLGRELLSALHLATSNFLLAYNTRAGIAVLIRALKLIQKRKIRSLFNLNELLDEKHLNFRVDAVSLGLFAGWFSGGYRGVRAMFKACLNNYKTHQTTHQLDALISLLSGSFAATSLVFLNEKRRRSLALYALPRALQCVYNVAKNHNYWHFWGSDWEHGDALLFAVSSAQVMYAFIMRPKTLPSSFFRFIQKTGPVGIPILDSARSINRQLPVDTQAVQRFVEFHKSPATPFPIDDIHPNILNCDLIHIHSKSCVVGFLQTFRKAYLQTFPLYLSLFIVPRVVLHFKKFLNKPFKTLLAASLGASRSNGFLAMFVALYQVAVCTHRRIASKDHRFIYYVAGLVASSAIFIEPKKRRPELALYVLPRAVDSLYMILRDRRLLTGFLYGEVLLFSLSMSIMMYCYEHEKDAIAPMIYSTLRRFLPLPSSSHLNQNPTNIIKDRAELLSNS